MRKNGLLNLKNINIISTRRNYYIMNAQTHMHSIIAPPKIDAQTLVRFSIAATTPCDNPPTIQPTPVRSASHPLELWLLQHLKHLFGRTASSRVLRKHTSNSSARTNLHPRCPVLSLQKSNSPTVVLQVQTAFPGVCSSKHASSSVWSLRTYSSAAWPSALFQINGA